MLVNKIRREQIERERNTYLLVPTYIKKMKMVINFWFALLNYFHFTFVDNVLAITFFKLL